MAWEVFKRDDPIQGNEEPFVTVSPIEFGFNAVFARLAEIRADKHVTIHVDPDNRKLGFEFHEEKGRDGYTLTSHTKGRYSYFRCSSKALLKKYEWVRCVSKLSGAGRRFRPRKEGQLWVIQLCPAFEERRARESANITPGIRGVYRYLRENGEIVYIGRGDIKARLASPERADWDFDQIEYSIVEDPDQQVLWETFCIDRFKEGHKGALPFYNRVSGSKRPEPDSEGDASGDAR